MRNTIFLDGSVSMYSGESLLRSLQKKGADGELTYQEVLESIQDYTASKTAGNDKSGMTIEEYKAYVAKKISELPRHDTKSRDTVIVDITDAGFATMKEDADYEQWVFDTVGRDLITENSLSSMTGGRCAIHRFGDKKEQYSFDSWGKARDITDIMASITAAEDSFWRGETSLTKRLSDEHMEMIRQQQLNQIMNKITDMKQRQVMTALNNIATGKV